MFRRGFCLCVLGLAIVETPAAAQTGFANIVDHIHLAAPDQAAAVKWYRQHFGGETMTEAPDRLLFGETRVIVQRNEKAQPSTGSSIDHIGFSVPDLDATMKALEAASVKIVGPARDVAGLFKLAFIEDPWGTRIEVVQDSQKLGLHHIHLRAPDPPATLAWYADRFGGTVAKLKDRIDGISYGGVWVLAAKGDPRPSQGHSIDHIGFRPLNVDDAVSALKAKSVKVTTEPRPLTLASGVSMRLAFVESPEGVRIELVQR